MRLKRKQTRREHDDAQGRPQVVNVDDFADQVRSETEREMFRMMHLV